LYRENGFHSQRQTSLSWEIWLAHTDGRQAALAEQRLGADGHIDADGCIGLPRRRREPTYTRCPNRPRPHISADGSFTAGDALIERAMKHSASRS